MDCNSARTAILVTASAYALMASPAWAQLAGGPDDGMLNQADQPVTQDVAPDDEIVVTARKRDETAIAVPVVLTTIGRSELERRGISDLDSIARVVPALIVGEGGGTIQGGNVAIRGIGGADTNPLGDQAVSFNIDGVAVARASVRRLSQMDVQQVEVLKGPQALFFGKNSPAGVISIRTADPTSSFEGRVAAGFEKEARELRLEGFVSGPLTDTLGARFAFSRSAMRGYARNLVPETSPYAPPHIYSPRNREIAGRLSLNWEPSDRLRARGKFSYSDMQGSGTYSSQEYISCPFGAPQPLSAGLVADCEADGRNQVGEPGDVLGSLEGFNGGDSYGEFTQALGSLGIDYDLTDQLILTSITGYYRSHADSTNNYTNGYYEPLVGISYLFLNIREISQELRITSDFGGPVNFVAGAFYQDSSGFFRNRSAQNPTAIRIQTQALYRQEGTALSGFAQVRWDVLPTLELAAGGRYSTEKKVLPLVMIGSGGPLATTGSTVLLPRIVLEEGIPTNSGSWNDFSPEATITWRPTDDLTLFGAYKQGFISGGFNVGASNDFTDILYRPQTIEGFEAGIKARLFDGTLRLDVSAYDYNIKDLQVTVPVGPTNSIELRNAAGSKLKGFELSANYRTPVRGLVVRGAVAYNHARYTDYISGCYSSQPAPECSLLFNPATGQTSLSQDLSGTQLVRAPDWSGDVGFAYERSVTSELLLGLSGDMSFSSRFFTSADNRPAGVQDGYQLFDASVYLASNDDRWRISFIGRNLGNTYYVTRSVGVSGTGGLAGSINPVPADVAGVVSRGRELWVRLAVGF